MKKKVLLGMSGGVDSSVCAILLKKKNFEVIGITFLFADMDEQNRKTADTAKELSKELQIKHYVIDLREEFDKTVINYFKEEYTKGNTPFPCAYCNPKVKFKFLNDYAIKLKCAHISTGHYVKKGYYNNYNYIIKGVDPDKDQSFFLWGLKQEILDKLIFPLGELTKPEVRYLAKNHGYKSLSTKKDSLGICFIEGNDYRKYLKQQGFSSVCGNFVNSDGEIIGKHTGITNYTIGQRRGLGVQLNKPVFVSQINTHKNEIVLSDYDLLYKKKLLLNDCNFINSKEILPYKIFNVKVRYRLQNTPCTIILKEGNRAEVKLLDPVAMIANGQTAVFYDEDRVVGGGFINGSF